MPTPSQIDAMVGPQEPPSYASIPSQNMSSARSPRVDSVVKDPMISTVATDLSMTSKISVRQDEAKASTTTALIAAATSGSPVIRKDPLSAPVDIMTHDEVKEAVKQLPEKGPFKLNLQKWQIKPEQYKALERYTKFDHTSEIRSKEDCDPRHVIKRWAEWISVADLEEKDRLRLVVTWLLPEIERNGLDVEEYAEPLLQYRARFKKANKKEKIDDSLLFDDMIGTSTIFLSRGSKHNFKITKKEFQETGASFDAVNLRIVTRNVAAGERLYEDYVQMLDAGGQITVKHWKSRTDVTASNPYGRDLLVYALHEAQIAKADVEQLKIYLRHHTTATTRKNTNNRIADATARINHWLALAVELDKVRLKDESTDESEAESGGTGSPITIEDDTPPATKARDETPSPVHQASRQNLMTSNYPLTKPGDHENVLPITTELKVPYDSLQNDRPVTTKAPTVLRVRLRPPKPPTDTDGQQKQAYAGRPPAKKPKRKRVIDDSSDSDGEFQAEEGIKPTSKRAKTKKSDEASKETPKEQHPITPKRQLSAASASTKPLLSHSIRDLSETDRQRREIYLRKHFLPIVNAAMKRAGLPHIRSVPKEWNVIKNKLLEAKVLVKDRNELLRRFQHGWAQIPGLQPGQIVAEASNDQESNLIIPAPPGSTASSTPRDSLIVKLSVYEGFDPAEYSANAITILPGFRYRFWHESHVQERIKWASIIEENVAATMRGEPPNGEWTRVYGQGKDVVNEWGGLVAEGYWDEFNGMAAEKGGWLWDQFV